MALTAWGDESGSDSKKDPGTYMIAVAMIDTSDHDDVRQRMQRLKLPGAHKVHWRSNSEQNRRRSIECIATLPVDHVVVVRCFPTQNERPERRRRKCLERVLDELYAREVHELTLESRGSADDRRDRELLDTMRSRHLPAGVIMRIHHTPGPKEAMLSVPDAVCGAITQARTGNSVYLDALSRITMIELEA